MISAADINKENRGNSMTYHNYETILEKEEKALKSRAIMLRHEKTGARIFILSNAISRRYN